jgi:hypothetical protein
MRLLMIGLASMMLLGKAAVANAQTSGSSLRTITTEEDYHRALKELSNWGRWGKDDELGAANLITPAKRKQALALVKEGIVVSMAHDVVQEKAVDAPNILQRTLGNVAPRARPMCINTREPITVWRTATWIRSIVT